jgi:S-disulfanyl-L-cysteine oxidoreductase SoxD
MKRLPFLAAVIGAVTVLGAQRHEAQPRYHPEPVASLEGKLREGSAVNAPSEPAHTVWDSVYTDAQATRGDSLYKTGCANCHGATLAGSDDGTPLTGDTFLGNWNGVTLAELYDKLRNTMPPDTPKTIPPDQVADMLAYILSQNHFPSGKSPLSADAERLKDIKFVASKP